MKTDKGVAAPWDSNHAVRSITAVWEVGRLTPRLPIGDELFLFAGDRFCKLPQALATDASGGNVLVGEPSERPRDSYADPRKLHQSARAATERI